MIWFKHGGEHEYVCVARANSPHWPTIRPRNLRIRSRWRSSATGYLPGWSQAGKPVAPVNSFTDGRGTTHSYRWSFRELSGKLIRRPLWLNWGTAPPYIPKWWIWRILLCAHAHFHYSLHTSSVKIICELVKVHYFYIWNWLFVNLLNINASIRNKTQ